jgi:hypothetical protein
VAPPANGAALIIRFSALNTIGKEKLPPLQVPYKFKKIETAFIFK